MENDLPNHITVLLVDDDEEDVFIIKRLFQQISNPTFEVHSTASFKQAQKAIKSELYNAYLIDYRLGEHSGIELLKYAEPEGRRQPFIVLTGVGDTDIEVKSMRLGASDYLVKGKFDAEMLSRTLRYALQRKTIEQQRIEHLIELNRSKDEFISLASHQLRTPATGVKQYLGMVLEGFTGDVDPAQRSLLEKAYESNERQLRIVTDLLKVAQVDSGKIMLKKSRAAINELVMDVIREQQESFEKRRQTITFRPASSDPMTVIDSGSIRMVVENIIDNASKYSVEGSHVDVRVRDEAKRLGIAVTDEGVGINPDAASRLFEKFSRLDNPLSTKVGGTGLGLYWAKKIVMLHDGSIDYKPNESGGTTFTVWLPNEINL
jgi:two-component system sensor histidine kinase/response regulator